MIFKGVFFITFSLTCFFASAQSFYIKPIWGSKVDFVRKNPANKIQTSQIYLFKEYSVNSNFLPDDIGLLFGFKFKKHPIAIETGSFRTNTGTGFMVYYYSNNNYYSSVGSFDGSEIATIPLLFRFWPSGCFYQKMLERRLQMSFSCGLAYILYRSPAETGTGWSNQINNSDTIYINTFSSDPPRSKKILDNTMFSVGISCTALTRRLKEILTINLQFYYVRHEQSYSFAEISINNSIPTRYYTRSTGTGFGLSISRNFNVYKSK